jgi:hypothetical protein
MGDFSDHLKPLYDGPAQLSKERQASNVEADVLSRHLFSRDGFLDRQARIRRVLEKDPLFNKSKQMNLSRPVRMFDSDQKNAHSVSRNDTILALQDPKHFVGMLRSINGLYKTTLWLTI